MSRKKAPRALLPLSLILQALAMVTVAIPLTNPVPLLNSTTIHTASTWPEGLISQNATSAGLSLNMFDYRIAGTPLILRISETGATFSMEAVNLIIDAAIRKVVTKINAGHGAAPIDDGKFYQLSAHIDMRISALTNARLTYFLLGKQFHCCLGLSQREIYLAGAEIHTICL